MTLIFLGVLFVIDLVLIYLVVRLAKTKAEKSPSELLDLTEERRYITDLRKSIQEELESVHAQSKDVLKNVSQLAAEAELEVKQGGESIAKELESTVVALTKKFESPLQELSSKQNALERVLQKVEREKNHLTKLILRAEDLCKLMNTKVPYQEILEELQDKKYQDARQMIARGHKPEAIAKELGISRAEVDLIATSG